MRITTGLFVAALAALIFWSTPQVLADISLIKDGQSHCAILVAPEVMAPDVKPIPPKFVDAEAERQRIRLRESVNDLCTI